MRRLGEVRAAHRLDAELTAKLRNHFEFGLCVRSKAIDCDDDWDAEPPYIAPSLDLYASFQYPGSSSDWLLLDAHSPVAHAGLLSWTGRVWSRARWSLTLARGARFWR